MKKYVFIFIISIFLFVGHAYAYISYTAGETVSHNGINFYVLKDSDSDSNTLTLLKKDPIKSSEIKDYISATEVAGKVDYLW